MVARAPPRPSSSREPKALPVPTLPRVAIVALLSLPLVPLLPTAGPAAQQGAILRGVVVDQSGDPLAGARVSVQRWDEGRSGQSVTSTGNQQARVESDTSEVDGSFTVLNLFPRVEYRVRVEKEGFVPREKRMVLRVAANDVGTVELLSGDVERARGAYERGYAAYAAGRLQDAMAPMEEVVEVYRDSDSSDEMLVVALGVLGQVYLQQNRVAEAAASFDRLLSIAPDSAIALRGLGQVNAMSGDTDAAVEHFERAVAIEPDNATGRFLLGYTLQLIGRADDAIPHLEAALVSQPGFPRAHKSLGMALADTGDAVAAIEHLEAYLAAAPGAPDTAEVEAKIATLRR
jgi:tetratricopeptide (TPR) repeat protein